MDGIRALLSNLEWWEFYDVCEELLRGAGHRAELADQIDAIFAVEGLPYRITEHGIEWRLGPASAQTISKGTALLTADPRLQGPAQQWEKAQAHLARRPPDPENCIKDAVGALEGTARILLRKPTQTLGALLSFLPGVYGIHPALAKAMSGLYGYRGDEQAIAHGATAALTGPIEEAELVLEWCGAAITYLGKKVKAP